jgi:hypothetical protein
LTPVGELRGRAIGSDLEGNVRLRAVRLRAVDWGVLAPHIFDVTVLGDDVTVHGSVNLGVRLAALGDRGITVGLRSVDDCAT